MARATVFTALHTTAAGELRIRHLGSTEEVSRLNNEIAAALHNHPAFTAAASSDEAIVLPVAVLRDAKIDRAAGFVNGVETSSQAIDHLVEAQQRLNALIATSANVRLFVAIE